MFAKFYRSVCDRLESNETIQSLLRQRGEDFDSFIGNEVLRRGQTVCDTALLGQLYAYRYSPMHYSALKKILPSLKGEMSLIDFGSGPGTALLALADGTDLRIHHFGLEIAKGMRIICEEARTLLDGRLGKCTSFEFPNKDFWQDVEGEAKALNSVYMFSYFFGQDLNASFVQALARAIRLIPSKSKTIIYTNPVGPHASWMPKNDIHHWYRRFCDGLGHEPKIRIASYSYEARSNLAEQTTRSGECAYDIWSLM